MKNLVLFFSLFFLFNYAFSQSRTLELEFNEVVDATRYDFEFREFGKTELIKQLSQKESNVELTLPFNYYEFRQRTLDKRKVPGPWSDWEKFAVSVPELKVVKPEFKSQINSNELESAKVLISWEGAAGVKEFEVEIIDIKTKRIIQSVKTEKSKIELKLPVAAYYEVIVKTLLPETAPNDLNVISKTQFSLMAASLDKPEIISLESPYARTMTWEKNNLADFYKVRLENYSQKDKKWETVFVSNNVIKNQIEFDPKWTGGKYILKVSAEANLRKSSPVQIEKFQLASTRTPAAEYQSLVTKAIDRVDGLFTQISWLVTQFELSSYVFESNSRANAKPLGGTFRAGLGYFKSAQPWGLSGFINTSRLILNGQNKDFANIDINALYRYKFTYRDELRLSAGISQKQVPVLIGNNQLQNFNFYNGNVSGPRLGFEYWYSLGPKYGFQVNYNQNFFNTSPNNSAPNGNMLKLPKSFQAGLLMSYQFTSNITGLAGLTHQEDNYEYEARVQGFPQPVITGSINQGSLKADYIGLMVEIGL